MATLITKNSSTASAVPAAGDLVKGELAVNVTDKKVYTKDNSAAVVKLVGSLGNQEANAVAITGGAINGTTIGATTPSTGAFTTASASSGFTGNLTGNVTGNVSGTAANVTGVVAIANGGTGLSALGTGVQSALGQAVTGSGSFVLSTSPSLTTPNLGTPSAAVLTNATGLPLTTGVTGTLGVANGGTGITAFGTGVATALGQNVTGSGGIVLATSPVLTTPNLGTPSAATLTNATGLPISTGVSGLGTNVATALAVNVGTAGAFVVNGGALGTPSGGTLTNCTGYPTSALSGSINLATQVTGTLATTNGGTGLTSFTANGVVYASSTSALTTGSALSFDGTNFATTGSGTVKNLLLTAGTLPGAGNPSISLRSADNVVYHQSGSANTIVMLDSAQNTMQNIGATAQIWNISNAEQMRLTSTGLGIGTSSPGTKLQVGNGTGLQQASISGGGYDLYLGASGGTIFGFASQAITTVFNTASVPLGIGTNAAQPLIFGTGGTEKMRLDSSGNLGLGVTPTSGWRSGDRNMQIGPVMSLTSDTNVTSDVGYNYYYNTSNFPVYLTNAQASRYSQYQGAHRWFTAGSGTAGTTFSFTQAMTLDASGNLGVGTTSPNKLSIARALTVNSTSGYSGLELTVGNASTFDVITDGGSAFISTRTSIPLVFQTNNSERARITSGGELLVGSTSGSWTGNDAKIYSVTSSGWAESLYTTGSAGGASIMRVDNTGAKFIDFRYTSTNVGSITTDGTATAYNTSSDYRLKNNQQPLTGSGAFIDALKPKTWNWTADGSRGVGFIAHEVQEVSPGSVVGTKDAVDEEGKPIMQAMEYGSAEFIANIIAELQSLRARVAQLEAK